MDKLKGIYLSIIVPFYNEEIYVKELYDRIIKTCSNYKFNYEIIFVNDGSSDNTLSIIKELSEKNPNLKYISFRKNFGQTAGLAAGFEYARGEIIISMDGDLQHKPEYIPEFLKKIEEGFDIVSGWREKRTDNMFFRKIPSRVANWLMSKISNVDIHDFGTTLKAYRKDVIKNIHLYGELHRFIPALASEQGIKITEIPIDNPQRTVGQSHYGISRIFRVFFDLITVKFLISYSTRPFHIFGMLGLFCFIIGFLIDTFFTIGWIFGDLHFNNNQGLLLFSVMMIIIGIQIFILGLLSEFLTRIYFESTNKKIYNIKETNFY